MGSLHWEQSRKPKVMRDPGHWAHECSRAEQSSTGHELARTTSAALTAQLAKPHAQSDLLVQLVHHAALVKLHIDNDQAPQAQNEHPEAGAALAETTVTALPLFARLGH